MKSKYYKIKLKTIGPIFIGSGAKLSKKEYIYNPFDKEKKVVIPDFIKMYKDIKANRHEKEFQKFIMSENKDLYKWLKDYKYDEKDYSKWTKYVLDCGDAILKKGETIEVLSFVKDSYNLPYVPGSSLKGMLRTILLENDILKNDKYGRYAENVKKDSRNESVRRKQYLSNNIIDIEAECYNSLEKNKKDKEDAVNDIMSGVIISDSKPLRLDDLVLCQKCDMNIKGNIKNLPVLRECIKPGVTIEFDMEIKNETGITKDIIMEAVNNFDDIYYKYVISKYPNTRKPIANTVWLGGGVGFHSKTIINALFSNYDDAFQVTDNIMYKMLSNKKDYKNLYKKHHHYLDKYNKVSPHIFKVTKYNGITYQMGCSQIEILEEFQPFLEK